MNILIPLLTSTAFLFFILFIMLVFALTARSHRARVKNDMRRIKSQVTRESPETEW